MFQIRAKILYNKGVKENYFHLAAEAPKIAREALPGQFLNIKVNDAFAPLLRRPLSIHRVKGANVELLYEVVGEATGILSQRNSGECLDIIGPLGNGFAFKNSGHKKSNILVAGGMGVAPLLFLAEKISGPKPLVLIGERNKKSLSCIEEFKKIGCQVEVSTDDGSAGFGGRVTDLLRKILPLAIKNKPLTIYACGPRPMLKEVSRLSKRYAVPCQVSLEEHMACGIGACLGCVVNTKEGFKRVCKEGPVFNGDEIIW